MCDLIISPLYDTSTHIEAQKPTETQQFQTSYQALGVCPTKALESSPGAAGLKTYLSAGSLRKSKSFGHLAAERLQFHSGEHLLEPNQGRLTLGRVTVARFSKMTAALF